MITVTVDTKRLTRRLTHIERDQYPFAVAYAITKTAQHIQGEETKAIEKCFDRPTPFTKRAVGIKAATKTIPEGEVFLKDKQAAYLGLQVTGGTRRPKRRALIVPWKHIRLNKYGNIPGLRTGKIQKLLARRDTFSGRVKGVDGIWQRLRGNRLKLLIAWEPKANYKKRFAFYAIALRGFRERFAPQFKRSLAMALKTAR